MILGIFSHFGIWMLILFKLGEDLPPGTLGRFSFLLTTFFGALSFYATHYDSTGTSRPDWKYLLG